jgi:hypothetical protein
MAKEKRIAKRQPLRYGAWIALGPEKLRPCLVSDISQSGARLDVGSSNDAPDVFVLMLSKNGAARRFCAVMWRRGTEMGVKFARTLADAEKLVPKPNAPEQGAPRATPEKAPAAEAAKAPEAQPA